MSPRRLDVSEDAERDLDSIFEYTVRTWGYERAIRYGESITETLNRLLTFPMLGHGRADLRPGMRAYAIAEHVVFYLVRDEQIYIVRVLHGREDFASAFADSDDDAPNDRREP